MRATGAGSAWPGHDLPKVRRGGLQLAFSRKRVLEGLWVLFVMGASSVPLFGIGNVERYVWAAIDVTVLYYLLREPRPLIAQALHHKIIMSWPALAIFSALWSLNPTVSLYHGLQLGMTIMAGFLFAIRLPRHRIIVVVFTALLFSLIASLVVTAIKPWATVDIEGNWVGLFPHKNMLGGAATSLIFTSACLLLMGWRPFLSTAALVLAVFTLAMSHSATSAVAAVATVCPIVLAFCYRQGRNVLSFGIGLLFIAGSCAVLAISIGEINVVKAVLQGFGKDATLTGRTILWNFGFDAFAERPWLGYGFKGYWQSPLTTAEYLRYVIGQPLWYFHNNFIEVAVSFGIMGPILLMAGLISAFVTTIRSFLRERGYDSLWCVLLVIYVTLLTLVEYPLFVNHSVWQFLLVAAMASAAMPGRGGRRSVGGARTNTRPIR